MSTIRQQIVALLTDQHHSAKDLSKRLGIPEKEVYAHLGHIARSLARRGRKLTMIPSTCLSCGYVFEKRTRFTKPGRCPRCRDERIDEPAYLIACSPGKRAHDRHR